jgi:precorrin-6A/cobalt-precorrin-6A reductase
MTRAKLDAAAALNVPVLMVARPALPAGAKVVGSVQDAADWVTGLR